MAIGGDKLGGYASNGVQPMTVAMRVNQKKDECAGLVLGFDWNKAYELTGSTADELAPQGGPANPVSGSPGSKCHMNWPAGLWSSLSPWSSS